MANLSRVAILTVVLAVVGLVASVATAGNGASTNHFTAAYDNGQGGFFTCSGERVTKTAPNAFTKDSETCTISDLSTWPAGTYTITPSPTPPPGNYAFWFSDFDGSIAQSGTLVVTDNGNGTGTMNITAYF